MMPHTPGPWKAKLGRTFAFDCSIVTEEGFIIARTSESNAPILAAAPDLLTALLNLRRQASGPDCWCEMAIDHPLVKRHSPECIAAHAAIAKTRQEMA